MGRSLTLGLVISTLCVCTLPEHLDAQDWVPPQDGTFFIEAKPAFTFQASLVEHWVNPRTGAGTLHLYAPVLPELPGQRKVATRLAVPGKDAIRADHLVELSASKRPMLALSIRSDVLSPKAGITARLEYEGVLYARTLKRGAAPEMVPALKDEERHEYLATAPSMDFDAPRFTEWIDKQGLKRRAGEGVMPFGHRVFTHFIKHGEYRTDIPGGYEGARPSQACTRFAGSCGGLSILYVAVMRANGVPARTFFGRWAVPQDGENGQHHVTAEFFVEKSGWVPVDVSAAMFHKSIDRYEFFGKSDGRFLAFHVDTDLEPFKGFRHGWAQYLCPLWIGEGDQWKDHKIDTKWDVLRLPLPDK